MLRFTNSFTYHMLMLDQLLIRWTSYQIEVLDKDIDACVITETWIKQDDIDTITSDIPPIGYKILSTPRP